MKLEQTLKEFQIGHRKQVVNQLLEQSCQSKFQTAETLHQAEPLKNIRS